MSDLPDGVESAMFLRDGWPRVVVCKVKMQNGCVGIGMARQFSPYTVTPSGMDAAALANAMDNRSDVPPDYTELHEHVAKLRADAEGQK